jgi:hypothetical protein
MKCQKNNFIGGLIMKIEDAIKECKLLAETLPNFHLGGSEAIKMVLQDREKLIKENEILTENLDIANYNTRTANEEVLDNSISKDKIKDILKELIETKYEIEKDINNAKFIKEDINYIKDLKWQLTRQNGKIDIIEKLLEKN